MLPPQAPPGSPTRPLTVVLLRAARGALAVGPGTCFYEAFSSHLLPEPSDGAGPVGDLLLPAIEPSTLGLLVLPWHH